MSCGFGRDNPRLYTSRRFVSFLSANRTDALGSTFTYEPLRFTNPEVVIGLLGSAGFGAVVVSKLLVFRFVPSIRTPATTRTRLIEKVSAGYLMNTIDFK